jgi:anti-sigma regulatory factor (Ser/Thr protein kinase)
LDTPTTDPFVHPALFYRDEAQFLAGTVPFLQDGLAAGKSAAAALPRPNLELLRAGLGPDAEHVRLIDMGVAGRNPGRIIARVLSAFADTRPGGVRIVGEPIWPGRSPTEYPACAQHEALINFAFAYRPVTILCPYDAARLDAHVLSDAAATHHVLIDADGERPSDAYAPHTVVSRYNRPGPGPEPGALEVRFSAETLHRARSHAADHAVRLGLGPARLPDLELAISEVITNSVKHGGGFGALAVWAADGHVVCQIRDRGTIRDPLAGRRPVRPDATQGRGLLLVNDLVDLVRLHSTEDGTTIHLYLKLEP